MKSPIRKSESREKKSLTRLEKILNEKFAKINNRFNSIGKTQQNLGRMLSAKIQVANRELEERLAQKISKFSNLILTTIDPLLKELETRQEDRELAAEQTAQMRK